MGGCMVQSTTARSGGQLAHELRVAALTMARDEAEMLPRWLDYYGGQLGLDNVMVIDDNSVDGSTTNLPCAHLRLPTGPLELSWPTMRKTLVNGFARGLLACYDVVIFTDVDEFLVPDPARHSGLLDYLNSHRQREVIAPLAVNVLHNPRLEPPLDQARPVLAQRRFVKFAPIMCKPLIKQVASDWSAGFHGIRKPFEIDRELLLLHLKFYDVSFLATVSQQRRVISEQEGRGAASTWKWGAEELTSRLLSWVDTPTDHIVPEFDPSEPDLTDVVGRSDTGYFRSWGTQLGAMEKYPLRQLPERFRQVL